MRETVVWTISLPPQMAEKAKALAKLENRSKSELVREALRQYMALREWEQMQAKASLKAQALGITDEAKVEEIVEEIRQRQ
ncbi:CopG family ribbon-helix-helix protein [Desulfovirgula thermocuniculi]|uniref:CopG family ribbon-helix-helix protein n=1 Tax=Desulfovirgula thermocuniculi TaxID=348842 RepID=UPI0004865D38|nr:ribbon-helix-helix protein, CopG family [Desulfovirgula thermocuniculi]